ncbi:hypothetical protein UFOVP908_61 [uncultured Caudovirales phage]|uniref:Uncharacterized protein n=1 Tax=uncultured Caudovirales phage TaxID=2100421 RepID=A0A6J5PXZ8_9CAUD|nr:hypothetical protein UFOVP908_61 [uncultured Caudovirales phage]CAB4176863.1 hypothetical protein UFOVP990_75 [uncultured Caudovirales phage]CAB4182006.1 hypothetical protein UFOVP1065_106 [uncultured Caudovirales phage]CAB4190602.1 hypothetical protein UFOVP1198_75 [uncultured Caudovirales phage]CAB4211033.1 hypothetical protein UFOVP1418_67 [uncultured Caudovirales phage]
MSESRELRIIAKQMQDMRIEASCLFNAADRIEKLEAALREIADGQRDADKSYAELFAEVKTEARKALEGKDD